MKAVPFSHPPMEAFVAALASLPDVGPARLRWLMSLGAPSEVWQRLLTHQVVAPPGISPSIVSRWFESAATISPDALWRRCSELGIGVSCFGAPSYPPKLLSDPDPPVVLFHQGSPDALSIPSVAIVGTRRATAYGRAVAHELGSGLAASGICVVSGLALGIDASAHAGAVESSGAPNWAAPAAVVGSGLDSPCPVRNRSLCAKVAASGVVLSEVPPGVPAAPWRFPVRNRILAGLAEVVVVVESAGGGGSMHTVREARERQLTVMAVPGPIKSPVSVGPHELLAEGALVCTGLQDVLAQLGRSAAPAETEFRMPPSADAAVVLECVGWLAVGMDRLSDRVDLPVDRFSAGLSELRRNGWVTLSDGVVERRAQPIAGPA